MSGTSLDSYRNIAKKYWWPVNDAVVLSLIGTSLLKGAEESAILKSPKEELIKVEELGRLCARGYDSGDSLNHFAVNGDLLNSLMMYSNSCRELKDQILGNNSEVLRHLNNAILYSDINLGILGTVVLGTVVNGFVYSGLWLKYGGTSKIKKSIYKGLQKLKEYRRN